MNNQSFRIFGVAALVGQCLISLACSSGTPTMAATGGGGSGGPGGAGGDVTPIPDPNNLGSCIVGMPNPDYQGGGACAPSPGPSTTNNLTCTHDCCVPCGIDMLGAKTCTCPTAGAAYNNCNCVQPKLIPTGLQGGPCMPQGYSGTPPTDPPGLITLVGAPCKLENASKVVCFTANSIASSERGCICLADSAVPPGTFTTPSPTGAQLHCASVNHWFINNGVPTPYN